MRKCDLPSNLIKSPENVNSRNRLASRILSARKRQVGLLSDSAFPYMALGSHYNLRGTTDFNLQLHHFVLPRIEKNEKTRWLDIGPGLPDNFMPYFERIDPLGDKVELHTLAPEQILSRKHPKYTQWKNRLTHHVGALETYNTRKLGKFHVIVSTAAGLIHTDHAIDNLKKTLALLEKGGVAFLDVKSGLLNREELISHVTQNAGSNFEVTHLSRSQFMFIKKK